MDKHSPFKKLLVRMARYHDWAYKELFKQINKIPEDQYRKDIGLYFNSLHGTLNRIHCLSKRLTIDHRSTTC
jgi:uncharacterized damage-inducible protein DinB